MPLTDADIRRIYGQRISEARLTEGLTQADLAERLTAAGVDTSPQAVSRWEVGAVAPRDRARHALALILSPDLFEAPNEAVA